jgi:hypothetical protein
MSNQSQIRQQLTDPILNALADGLVQRAWQRWPARECLDEPPLPRNQPSTSEPGGLPAEMVGNRKVLESLWFSGQTVPAGIEDLQGETVCNAGQVEGPTVGRYPVLSAAWLKVMKADNDFIFRVARAAGDDAEFILPFGRKQNTVGQDTLVVLEIGVAGRTTEGDATAKEKNMPHEVETMAFSGQLPWHGLAATAQARCLRN